MKKSENPTLSWATKTQRVLDFVQAQHADSGSPGWALAVVHGNETLIAQGFGVNEVGNLNNPVTPDSMFHIGSVSKTMIAVGLAKLVDQGRLTWQDRVKRHLPWFQLLDKYAETYTTLADLLSMNSVLGYYQGDLQTGLDAFESEREIVERLQHYHLHRSFRAGYNYSNINFVILGQVLAHVTNQTWGEYLTEAIWRPLGMTHTFATADETPLATRSFGHYICNGKLVGPFDIALTNYSTMPRFGDAAGSVVSSIQDMATFAKFLLQKGQPLFASPQPIADMITGHIIQTWWIDAMGTSWGYHFDRTGGHALGAGYGIDVIGEALYPGIDYFDKNGDTGVHQTRTGFVPSRELGVVLFNNGQLVDKGSRIQRLGHVRTYILGLLLDLPDAQLQAAWDESVQVADANPDGACDPHVYDGEAWVATYVPSAAEAAWLAGSYATAISAGFFGSARIHDVAGSLHLAYGGVDGALVGQTNATYVWDVFYMGQILTIQVVNTTRGTPSFAVYPSYAGASLVDFDADFTFFKQ
ncbi:Aste57867_17966 [Aphanomyces stellatus]|uniref:Aste57867_17966 protein n=1 Tax=Aphanomyces stellatus TaxID=120398 RepID=A0A485LAK8_9STRA|nr:hypothetical protein As57867_017904 [Aphanomyces stellatus]VFT94706.1 Aste57867_17966 [Aphanomyces stellatus]